jgi:hypothetical protein
MVPLPADSYTDNPPIAINPPLGKRAWSSVEIPADQSSWIV